MLSLHAFYLFLLPLFPLYPKTARKHTTNILALNRHRPRHHGRYHRYLRPRRLRPYLRWPRATSHALHILHPIGCRALCRSCWFGCWVNYPPSPNIPLLFPPSPSLIHFALHISPPHLPLHSPLQSIRLSFPFNPFFSPHALCLTKQLTPHPRSFAIGIVGDAGVRGTAQQPRLFVGMILILIFAEVLGLYGLIVALLMNSKATTDVSCNPK